MNTKMVKNYVFKLSFKNETGGLCTLISISTDLHQYNTFIDFTDRKNYYVPAVLPTTTHI